MVLDEFECGGVLGLALEEVYVGEHGDGGGEIKRCEKVD